MKYFVYTRKSSEDEERQVLSIETQLDKAREMFGNLDIADFLTESHSAFTPMNRPVFADMIKRLENGEAEGIISWHPDRLSRNEVDAAAITYMIRTGKIKDLKFGSYTFENSPEGMMMLQIVMSQSQYFSAKLSKDVKRGVEKKIKMGWHPGVARLGYLNTPDRDKGTRIIIKDPERYNLVRKMWDLMLTGAYTVPEVLSIANNLWGMTTVKRKKMGGTPLSRSATYDMFTSPFYAGQLFIKGEYYPGSHEAMVTLEEFDKVQLILGRKGKPRPQKHRFAYTGFIRCGECGCAIVAEQKPKLIKGTGLTRTYVYYHCTRRRPCEQRKVMRLEDLERQIEELLSGVTILPEFRDWALEVLRSSNDLEIEDRSKIHIMQSKTLIETQQHLDNLTKMRYRDLITDEEYREERQKLTAKITRLQEQRDDTEGRAEKWLELTEKTFDFATYARGNFLTGDIQTKKEILMALGENPTLKDGKLQLNRSKWLQPIAESYPALEAEYKEVRTKDYGSAKQKEVALSSINAKWLRRQDSNLRPID